MFHHWGWDSCRSRCRTAAEVLRVLGCALLTVSWFVFTEVSAQAPPAETEEARPRQPSSSGQASSSDAAPSDSAAGGANTGVARGRYVVHHVAMCVECHSPRTGEGELIDTSLLQGGSIPFERPFGRRWALKAPPIRGLPGWEREAAVQLLQTGEAPGGFVPRPPMPPFRMDRQDAEAVVDYLLSLK